MTRLPQPGQDDGIWGDVLNEYLSVAHTPTGVIKSDSIIESQLHINVRAKLNAAGPTGPKGDQGDVGPQGPAGPDGISGLPGVDGASAYELAVEAGFVGTQSAWLASLKGAKGDTGDAGPGGVGDPVSWAVIVDKPTTFTPSSHTHAVADITALQSALDAKVATLDGSYRVYINDHNGIPSFVVYSATTPGAYSMMQRDAGGRSVVETPDTAMQVANKAYVDAAIQPAGSTMHAVYAGGVWPVRPTDRADVLVFWVGGTVAPAGALAHDIWFEE